MITSTFVCNDFYNYVFYNVLRLISVYGHIILYEMVLELLQNIWKSLTGIIHWPRVEYNNSPTYM